MDKKNRVKSIASTTRENHRLVRKLMKQKKRYMSIMEFKEQHPELTADFLYEIRLDDPMAKKHVIENRLKKRINDYLVEEDERAIREKRLAKNKKIIEEQDELVRLKQEKKAAKKGVR